MYIYIYINLRIYYLYLYVCIYDTYILHLHFPGRPWSPRLGPSGERGRIFGMAAARGDRGGDQGR